MKTFDKKVSGTSMQGRDELKVLLDFMREGDELVVTRVDLARSVYDLQDIVKTLDAKGVTLSATEQPISTKDATSKCFLDMDSVFAELRLTFVKSVKQKVLQKQRKEVSIRAGNRL